MSPRDKATGGQSENGEAERRKRRVQGNSRADGAHGQRPNRSRQAMGHVRDGESDSRRNEQAGQSERQGEITYAGAEESISAGRDRPTRASIEQKRGDNKGREDA